MAEFYFTNFLISLGIGLIIFLIQQYFKNKPVPSWKVAALLTIIIFILISVVYKKEMYEKSRSNLQKIRGDFATVRNSFERLPCYDCPVEKLEKGDKDTRNYVYENIKIIIIDLKGIDDSTIPIGDKIVKYDFLAYSFAIFSELEKNDTKKEKLISNGLKYIEIAQNYINDVENSDETDKYIKDIKTWIVKDHAKDRLLLIKAWLTALDLRRDKDISEYDKNRVNQILNKVDQDYLDDYDLKNMPSLQYFTND